MSKSPLPQFLIGTTVTARPTDGKRIMVTIVKAFYDTKVFQWFYNDKFYESQVEAFYNGRRWISC